MSVIVRDEEGKLLLLSKGADRFVILFITCESYTSKIKVGAI